MLYILLQCIFYMMFQRIVSDQKSKCKTIIEFTYCPCSKEATILFATFRLVYFVVFKTKYTYDDSFHFHVNANKLVQSLDNLICSPSILVTLPHFFKLRVTFPLVHSTLMDSSISFMMVPSSISTWKNWN